MKKKPPRRPRKIPEFSPSYRAGWFAIPYYIESPNYARKLARWILQWADWAEYVRGKK